MLPHKKVAQKQLRRHDGMQGWFTEDNDIEAGKAKTRAAKPKRYLPEHDNGKVSRVEERFEVVADAAVDSSLTYGLNVTPPQRINDPAAAADSQFHGLHLVARNEAHSSQRDGQNGAHASSRDWETKAFKDSMQSLPEEADEDAYAAMPIAEFGTAMMRAMGWVEGQGVGRRKTGPTAAIQYVQRPHRLGLGAQPAPTEEKPKKHLKPGESREGKKHKVFIDKEGRQKPIMTLDDKLVDAVKLGVQPGKTMHLLSGRHEGLACEVLALESQVAGRSDRAKVRLLVSNAVVTVRCSELGEKFEADAARDVKAAEKAAKKAEKDANKRAGKHHRADDDRRHGSCAHDHSNEPLLSKRQRTADDMDMAIQDGKVVNGGNGFPNHGHVDELPWLAVNIRVRIIDRSLAKGQLYLKKGTVVDVQQPKVCDIVTDDPQRRISGVTDAQVETLVPKEEGATILILRGEFKGQRAKLLHRNVKAGAAAVQLTAELAAVKVSLDDIAGYVGAEHEHD